MEEALIAFVIFFFVFLIVRSRQQHKLEELRIIRGHGGQGLQGDAAAELRQLQQQVAELRDTTTRYDMSFDAALQRIESRVSHLEGQQRNTEAQLSAGQGTNVG